MCQGALKQVLHLRFINNIGLHAEDLPVLQAGLLLDLLLKRGCRTAILAVAQRHTPALLHRQRHRGCAYATAAACNEHDGGGAAWLRGGCFICTAWKSCLCDGAARIATRIARVCHRLSSIPRCSSGGGSWLQRGRQARFALQAQRGVAAP